MATKINPSPNPLNRSRHNILISVPRTASNLVTHLLALSSQPSVLAHPRDGYFFLPALSHRFRNSTFTRLPETWSSEERKALEGVLKQSAEAWTEWVSDAENDGSGTYVKEHVNWMISPSIESAFLHPTSPANTMELSSTPSSQVSSRKPENPTAVPDAFWKKVRPTFLIRHPALAFPSCLRTAIDNEGLETVLGEESERVMRWECTFHWHVLLYKFLASQISQSGLSEMTRWEEEWNIGNTTFIIDASQLQDEKFVTRYAEAVGLDPDLVRTSWSATSAEEQTKIHAIERRMKDTLLGSSGIVREKLDMGSIDIAAEREKWQSEFGPELALRLGRLVSAAMGEYEWMYGRRWRG